MAPFLVRSEDGDLRADRTLRGIVAAGFALRLAWLLLYPQVIENEGAVYAGLAENLFAGRGYVWVFGGRYANFPPLYPVLIGAASYITGATDTACRIVSLLTGTLLPVPVFLVTEILFGRRAALAASALAAIHPMLVALSGSAYAESTYFTVWFFAIWFALRALRSEALKHAALSGLFSGLAYLIRPEAIAYSFLTVLWILLSAAFRRSAMRGAFLRASAVILVFAALAAPYSAWLSIHSGKFVLEGKSHLVKRISAGMVQGKSYSEVGRGLGPGGEPQGIFLFPDQIDLMRGDPDPGPSLVETVFFRFRHKVRTLWTEIWTLRILGSPAIALLATGGFLTFPLRNRKFLEEGFLAATAAAYLLALFSAQWRWVRYLFPVSLLLIPWTGAGVSRISLWVRERMGRRYGNGSALARWAAGATTCLLFAGMAVPCVPAVLGDNDFHSARFTGLREGGRWLHSRKPGHRTVMSNSVVLAYYSRGTSMYLPYAPADAALEYIHRKNPDFIVLRADDRDDAPYIPEWLRSGIPDPCAKEIHRIRREDRLGLATHDEDMAIYEWRCGDDDPRRDREPGQEGGRRVYP
jgi:4-amino-4-deoxy-L-arabinose transferase-like glycosyltransferase